MNPERWEKIQRIFRSALTYPNDSHASYLERECGDDTELRREIESLIAAGKSMEGFLEDAIEGAAAAFDNEPEFVGDDRFVVLRRLGSGGFGVVYQVYDRHRETIVALKTLRRTEAGALLQLKREFRVLADMSHPNLVNLYELFSEEGRWFFTMELVVGVDFLRYTRDLGDDFDQLRGVMRQLADGVSAVHQYGKLHCDLKPRNVLVDNSGRVMILDFGLVTDFSGADSPGGAVLFGTPGYMSPEQAAGQPLSPASDWYSVGVILYEALTGEMPISQTISSLVHDAPIISPASLARRRPNAPGDLCDLAAALLQRDPLLRPTGSRILRSLGMPAEESMRAAWLERAPFIGRENELATLREALREADRGRLTTVFMHGPSGVGKSLLARQFLDEVREPKRHLVLEGCCHERESTPYKALDSLMDNLNRHLGRVPKAERAALIPSDFSALTRLFPALDNLAWRPGRVEIANAAELRLRGFQALRELLTRLAVSQPIVLLIDDLQWGDMDSAPFLLDLVTDPLPARILFLACFRSDEAESSPLLKQLLRARSLGTSGRRIELPVHDLEYGAARDLALWLLRRHESVSPSLADQIAHESGGNPFFLGQLVKHWQTESRYEGDDRSVAADWTPRRGPISLDDLVRRRVESLPERPRRLLEVIALAGEPIELALAKDAARLDVAAYTELAELRRHRLIRTRRTEASEEIEAYHDRIRHGTEGSLSPEGLQDCHFRLATAWESAGRSDARFLAVHFRAARVGDKALAYSIRAAEEAAAALAFDNAAQFYRFAVELAPEPQRNSWQVKLGEALCNAGRGAEGASVYLAAAAGSGSRETLELRRRAAAHFLMAGRIDEGLALTQEVLKMVGMSLSRWTWQALLSFFFQRIWIRARGLKFRERSLSEIPAARLVRIDICASVVQGLAMVDPIRIHPFHARLMLLALRSGELSRISRGFCFEAGYFALAGGRKKDRVERLLGSAQEFAQRSGSPNDAGMVALTWGVASFLRGAWKDAADQMTTAEGILRERCTGVAWEVATAHMMGSVSLFLMGEWKELTHRLPRIIKDAEARGDLFEATDLRIRLAHSVCLAADDADHAHEEIRSALAGWRRQEFDLQHWWAWIGNIETDLYRGEASEAWTRIREEWPRLRWSFLMRVRYVYIESLHHRARAALALAAAGKSGPRAQLLRRAEHDALTMEREGSPWSSALATLLRAGISAARGALGQSTHLLESAEYELKACDMTLYALAAQRARGQLLGGERGRELSAEAEKGMQNQEIVNPQRIAAMLAPGF